MKSLILIALLCLNDSASANQYENLTITSILSSQESYRLYEFLDVPEVSEQGGRALVKRTSNMVCTRFGAYPGDREYECMVTISLKKAGEVVLRN
jgi:hypothetical protein